MGIVVDKSYLQGATGEEIRRICESGKALMPQSLFYELLTTSPQVRSSCFRKIPSIENPFTLVPNVGTLLRFETQNGRSCRPITQVTLKERYGFNVGLGGIDFDYGAEQYAALSEWRALVAHDVREFKKRSADVGCWFPKLDHFRPGDSSDPLDEAVLAITRDHNLVKGIYAQIRHRTFPAANNIDEKWAFFRWVQIQLLAAVEYVRKYGPGNSEAKSKKIENDFLDIEYCITGAVVGCLATRDKKMAAMFNGVNPNGVLIS